MANALLLFTLPKKSPFIGDPDLTITGTLTDYIPSASYESRLQINNSIGQCTVKLISGNLPIGATISVDNDSHEVVVKWPSYQEIAAPITNAQAENNKNGWSFSAGWGISSSNPISGSNSFSFANLKGFSYLISNAKYLVSPGTPIHASCQVRQGASSSGSAGAACILKFFKEDGLDALIVEGNLVDSANNNAVFQSDVYGESPEDAAYVSIGAKGFRKSQNKTVWVDDFIWDHVVPSVGTNTVDSYCIDIRVKDAANRTAIWSGCIVGVEPPTLPKYVIAGANSSITSGLSISEDGFSFGTPFTPTNYFSFPVQVYSSIANSLCGITGSLSRTSVDNGQNFTLQPSFDYNFTPSGGASSNGLLLIPLSSNVGIARSTDNGETWTLVANDKTSSVIVISENLIVSLGSPNKPMYSLDSGVTWSALGNRLDVYHPLSFNTGIGDCGCAHLDVVYFGGSIWGGDYGVSAFIPGVISTTDGINFTATKVSTIAAHGEVSRIAVTDLLSVLVTQNGYIYYKDDTEWILSSHSPIGTPDILKTNGNTFILGGGSFGSKKLFISTNGNDWTEISNPFNENLTSLVLMA